MYSNTQFSSLMEGLPKSFFTRIIQSHNIDKHSKGFSSWDQLLAMVFSQLTDCKSLRDIEVGFNAQSNHHYHLGTRTIKRSTLADANKNKTSDAFADVCQQLLKQMHGKYKKQLQDLLYLMDATPIPLYGLGYNDWTADTEVPRGKGLKVHMVTAGHDLPVQAEVTATNIPDVVWGRNIELEENATYVFDKRYCDYNWWFNIHQAGAYFVTRLKKTAGVNFVKLLAIPEEDRDSILKDELISFKTKRPGGRRHNHYYGTPLRRITIKREDKSTPIILVTNDQHRTAKEISELYKKRWGIELFFKWIKQNLKIKKFIGQSANAVKIQIYTALIAYILVYMHHQRHDKKIRLKDTLTILKSTLFQRPKTEEGRSKNRQVELERRKLQGVLAL